MPQNIIQCRACSWYCKISPGATGICGIRENIAGKLFLLTYGKPLHGLAVDPVEKKPLFHFLPGTEILSFGTYGCNFACEFCQNWGMSQYPRLLKNEFDGSKQAAVYLKKEIGKIATWEPERIVDYALENNIPSIAYTYNEPAVFFEYAFDTAKIARKKGIRNVFVSNGYESKEALESIGPYLDAINIDLKSSSERFYLKICRADLKPVLENIKKCFRMGIWVEVTTLIIPTQNDSTEDLEKSAQFLAQVSEAIPWHLSAYHPDYRMNSLPRTSLETLHKAYAIGRKSGLKYVYLGNVSDPDHSATYCPHCEKRLIIRDWQSVNIMNINKGKCGNCKIKIEGVWK